MLRKEQRETYVIENRKFEALSGSAPPVNFAEDARGAAHSGAQKRPRV